MKSYPMDPDLVEGLTALADHEHLPVSAIVRRAVRRELERAGVLAPPAPLVRKTGAKGGLASK